MTPPPRVPTLVFLVRMAVATASLVVITLAVLVALGWWAIEVPIARRVPEISADSDSAALARGRHLALVACSGCHGRDDGPLSGSVHAFADDPVFGRLWAPNLTPGGALAHYTDGELERAIREGIRRDGRSMVLMPSQYYRRMADEDLWALLGWLRAQPRVERAVPERRMGPLAYLLLGLRVLPRSAQRQVEYVATPHEAPDAMYGRYLAPLLGCQDCHGDDYRGRKPSPNGPPAGPDLVALADTVDFEGFSRALRGGVSSRGLPLDPNRMPWPTYSHLTDLETVAVWEFVKGLD